MRVEDPEPPPWSGFNLCRVLGGLLVQDWDREDEAALELRAVTERAPTARESRSAPFRLDRREAREVERNRARARRSSSRRRSGSDEPRRLLPHRDRKSEGGRRDLWGGRRLRRVLSVPRWDRCPRGSGRRSHHPAGRLGEGRRSHRGLQRARSRDGRDRKAPFQALRRRTRRARAMEGIEAQSILLRQNTPNFDIFNSVPFFTPTSCLWDSYIVSSNFTLLCCPGTIRSWADFALRRPVR